MLLLSRPEVRLIGGNMLDCPDAGFEDLYQEIVQFGVGITTSASRIAKGFMALVPTPDQCQF